MCQEANVIIEYLPPYSPDMNPIKASFAVLKAWIRANQDAAKVYEDESDMGGFEQFLEWAVESQAQRGDPAALFRLCGYISME